MSFSSLIPFVMKKRLDDPFQSPQLQLPTLEKAPNGKLVYISRYAKGALSIRHKIITISIVIKVKLFNTEINSAA